MCQEPWGLFYFFKIISHINNYFFREVLFINNLCSCSAHQPKENRKEILVNTLRIYILREPFEFLFFLTTIVSLNGKEQCVSGFGVIRFFSYNKNVQDLEKDCPC